MTHEQTGLPPKAISEIQRVLSENPEVDQAILYGSRALGTYRPNSDIDLTLVGDHISLSQLLSIENEIDDLLLPYKVDLSVKSNIDNSDLLKHIEKFGKVFYQR